MTDTRDLELESFETLDDVRDAWVHVAAQSSNLFATWEWTSTWWRHFGSMGSPIISVARKREGGPAAIVPLYRSRRGPLRIMRFIGHGPSDWLGPIHAPGDAAAASWAMQEALTRLDDWDVLLTENVRTDQRPTLSCMRTVIRKEAFPILPFNGRTWEELLRDRSANFRQQVRRRERRLMSDHALRLRLCSDPTTLDADMDLLFELHAARWARGHTHAFSGPRRTFHKEFARVALERGWLRLWMMELDAVPVAAWYGFRYANVEWYYQSGRDPVYESSSVGFVLLCHTIREATRDGMSAYWFLRGDEAYKQRFAEQDPGVETSVSARTPRGRTALFAAQMVGHAPATIRRYARSRLG